MDEGRKGADGPAIHQFIVSRGERRETIASHLGTFRLVWQKDESSL